MFCFAYREIVRIHSIGCTGSSRSAVLQKVKLALTLDIVHYVSMAGNCTESTRLVREDWISVIEIVILPS